MLKAPQITLTAHSWNCDPILQLKGHCCILLPPPPLPDSWRLRSTGGDTWRTLLREAAPHLGLEEDKKERGLAAHMRLLTLKLRDSQRS